MQNMPPLTYIQSPAEINADFYNLFFRQNSLTHYLLKGAQEFHADIDDPSDTVLISPDLMIFIRNEVGLPPKSVHKLELFNYRIYFSRIVFADALRIHPLAAQFLDF